MALRPALSLVLRELLRGGAARAITLDDVARALGATPASSDEIEALFVALEGEGHTISDTAEGEARSPRECLGAVLTAARARASRGERATVGALASDTGLSEDTVRAALRFASVLGR
ncbi:MAG TPA: hypothetical protein PLR99_06740 [Polyangiaceae bacterium]|jgi:hypothetical protein|nr:hypothetical protein [Polyangiaceae bacterium]